jgi:hypothetical protein
VNSMQPKKYGQRNSNPSSGHGLRPTLSQLATSMAGLKIQNVGLEKRGVANRVKDFGVAGRQIPNKIESSSKAVDIRANGGRKLASNTMLGPHPNPTDRVRSQEAKV